MDTKTHPANKWWHVLSTEETLRELESDAQKGLSSTEVKARQTRYGANVLIEKPKRSLLRMLMGQFADFMILILIGAAVISGMIGDIKDTIAIIVIIVLNAVIGFVQEFRAERAMAALKAMAAVS
ncbi:MAG: cation-transporting P-type ATPase, partial [Gallionellaceae bacterium]